MLQSRNDNTNSFNTTDSHNHIHNNNYNNNVSNYYTGDEKSEILRWLSPLEPNIRHQTIRNSRVADVGDWLLKKEEFGLWRDGNAEGESDNATLFCYGDPGAGKTYISSLVVDNLCDQARGQNTAVACFYFDYTTQNEQSPTSMLGSLLRQIVGGLEEIPEKISRAYKDQKKVIGGRGLTLSEIVELLQITSSSQPTFICIDALDECVEVDRLKVLRSLREILNKSHGIRIFLTGRPHVRGEIEKRLAGMTAILVISPKRGDVTKYLRARLDEDLNSEAMDDNLEADIMRMIPDTVSEIFLLVSLNIDAILQETTVYRRRQILETMTNGLGLGDAYSVTLERIRAQGGQKARLGMATLMWICYSERPLGVGELCQALAIEIGSPELNIDNVPPISTVLRCCQGLVSVDPQTSTVRLIHFSLKEYLCTRIDLFANPHSTMAETCLTYLNSRTVLDLRPILRITEIRHIPFLEYASVYWGVHANRGLSNCARLLAMKLFDRYENHISARVVWVNERPVYLRFLEIEDPFFFPGIHCASAFGLIGLVSALIEMQGCDINQPDRNGRTPLSWAAKNGHEGVVKLLLAREDVNPNTPDNDGQTPLWLAIDGEHEGVVKLLLAREDVNPNTPLWLAIDGEREGVVKLLLAREDVNPNTPDNRGQTPLSWAARGGHEEVVKLLLAREDVNPNTPDIEGWTSLSWAAENGCEGVVKLLLAREDVDPDTPDDDGATPLSWAAWSGHEGVVKLLLVREDVDPNTPDNRGQTPLSWAAENGCEGVVKLLLAREDVNPDTPDDGGVTPLWWAAGGGHEGVVKLLLAREDVNPDTPDDDGVTPLWWAAHEGHEGVVKILQDHQAANPSTR